MQSLGSLLLLTIIILVAISICVFSIEVFAAVLLPQPRTPIRAATQRRPRVAVLVPAHNESAGLRPTLENVRSQLREGDRVLVVADNCSDDTSVVASVLGAEVIERQDPFRIGKGYALDFGIKHLALDPPEVLIVVDADCVFSENSLDVLADTCMNIRRPVQALNLMKAPDGFGETFQLAEFAWRVKNWVRPLGLRALHLPCQLTGTGMAFTWDVVRVASLSTGEIVEDLKFGLDLAAAGKPAFFCPSASVVSYFPISQVGVDSQTERWQKGHLKAIWRLGPRMVGFGIWRRDIGLLVLALDLLVPPLVLLALIQFSLLVLSLIALCFGDQRWSFYIVLATSVLFFSATAIGWMSFARDVVPARKLIGLPLLAAKRLRFYKRLAFERDVATRWVRTDRSKPNGRAAED